MLPPKVESLTPGEPIKYLLTIIKRQGPGGTPWLWMLDRNGQEVDRGESSTERGARAAAAISFTKYRMTHDGGGMVA